MDCPNGLKTLPVSTTVRPVTQTAEVEVNNAFTNPRCSPAEAAGSINRIVPMEIKSANPIMAVRAGDRAMDFEIRMDVFLLLKLLKRLPTVKVFTHFMVRYFTKMF